MPRWIVPVELIVDLTEHAGPDDAAVTATRAAASLRDKGVLPGGVAVGRVLSEGVFTPWPTDAD